MCNKKDPNELEVYTGNLEDFQNETRNLGSISLNRYDRFYRKTSRPLYLLTANTMFKQLDLLVEDKFCHINNHVIDYIALE